MRAGYKENELSGSAAKATWESCHYTRIIRNLLQGPQSILNRPYFVGLVCFHLWGKAGLGGGSADILMLYPTPAASLWGLRQALFTWAGCCGPIALLRDKVRGGTSKRTQRDGFLVGCICRNSWCRCLGDGLCGSNCHDFHICEPRGYKETRGTSENLNHPGVSWHHDIKNILLDRWLISHY